MSKHNVSQETQDIIDFMVDAEPGLHDSPLGAKNIGAAAPDLAHTVEQQAAQIERLEMTLFRVEMIVERATRKGYFPDAYELAEILGLEDNDE